MFNIDVQKVLHLHLEEAKKKPKIQGEYMVTEKLDGWYVYVDYCAVDGWGPIRSRQGRIIPSLVDNTDFYNMKPRVSCRIIAEATIPGMNFHELNGVLNRSKGDCQASGVKFYAHDIILLDDLDLEALERYDVLHSVIQGSSIERVPLLALTDDRDNWMYQAQKVWERGGEGVVLKAEGSTYQPGKRNSSLMKIKLEELVVGECTHFYYTVGDKGNRNLNIGVRLASGSKVDVRIPKFSDIAAIEDDSSFILGKEVELKCMCKLPDGSLREPRFNNVVGD